MLGVVLWSNAADSKAVIWCEDHGDLAFYSGNSVAAEEYTGFDVGDLVQFEMCSGGDLRKALNPRRIEQGTYFGVVSKLSASRSRIRSGGRGDADSKPKSPRVFPFRRPRKERPERELLAV